MDEGVQITAMTENPDVALQYLDGIPVEQKEWFFSKINEIAERMLGASRDALYIIVLAIACYFARRANNQKDQTINEGWRDEARLYLRLGLSMALILIPGIPLGDILGMAIIGAMVKDKSQIIAEEAQRFAAQCIEQDHPMPGIPERAWPIVRKAALELMKPHLQDISPAVSVMSNERWLSNLKHQITNA